MGRGSSKAGGGGGKAKTPKYTGGKLQEAHAKIMEDAGFNRWTKGSYDRLYANEKALGMRVVRYNTGNISYAELNGEKISNSYATDILSVKAYIDVNTGNVHVGFGTIKAQRKVEEIIESKRDKLLKRQG